MNLQSGYARPYWEAHITVSGDASTFSGVLGKAYTNTNDILSMGSIDRERPFGNSGLSRIIAGDMSLTLNNGCGTYSPLHTGSIFCDAAGSAKDYFNSIVNIWAGFENLSGTAYTIQRGSFTLTKLRIDSENRVAYLSCEDAAKVPLQKYIGLPDLSGTAVTWNSVGGDNTKAIIENILSGVGLSATQYDIASGLDFVGYAVRNVKASEAIAKLAQANDGYIYTNGKGQVVFTRSQTIIFGLKATDLELKNSDRIVGLTYTQDVNDLIEKTQVNYTTGLVVSRSAEDTSITKGRQTIINNDTINQGSIAYSIASRTVGQFKKTRTFLELDNVWLPSLDLGNIINIYDTNTYQTGISYEIYRIREDFINCKTKIDAISVVNEKWGFVSTSDNAVCGTEFKYSWHSGFAFISYDLATAVNPGLDLEGNNNNVVNLDYVIPGAPTGTQGTGCAGIEIPFFTY